MGNQSLVLQSTLQVCKPQKKTKQCKRILINKNHVLFSKNGKIGLTDVFYEAMKILVKFHKESIAACIERYNRLKLENDGKVNKEIFLGNEEDEDEDEEDESEVQAESEQEQGEIAVWNSIFAKNTTTTSLQAFTEITMLKPPPESEEEMDEGEYAQAVKEIEDTAGEKVGKELPTLKIAIIGKPNVGKSSLLNALVGGSRAIVSDIAGTTHDPVDEYIRWRGETDITLVDTAGIRRRAHHKIGFYSFSLFVLIAGTDWEVWEM